MAGIICCGIGAGVTFQEYSSFKYMGEKRIGSNKIAEKTLTENLYTDKTKKLNTSFIAYNNENENIELKTSKSVPKDKIQIKVRYDADNVKDIHIDKNLYNDDEYIGDDIYIDDDYDENSMDNVALENMTQTDESVVCIPSSRQLKKYKIFVLPDIQPGNIFMPPIVAFHEIPLVLRLQALSVAGRLYSNLYIL